ncbi:50S ribosomal protein L30 [Rickettsiales bacterium LUAb2]
MAQTKKIKLQQVKSAIRKPQKQKDWLLNLGFTKMHQIKEFNDTPAVRGIIKKVEHLLKVID